MRPAADELERLEQLANLLDARFTVPGTSIRFGVDSVLGLIPALGDAAGLFASLYIMTRLERLGLPRWTRRRMLANVAIDALAGAVPLLGDLFDVAFKANRRNIALARRALEKAGRIPITIDAHATRVGELLPKS
jgi:hypothetical protein